MAFSRRRLCVKKRRARLAHNQSRTPILVANARRSFDFVYDQLASGRRFRIACELSAVIARRCTKPWLIVCCTQLARR